MKQFTIEQRRDLAKLPNDKKYTALVRHIETLAPAGSEFVNDPLKCLNHLVEALERREAQVRRMVLDGRGKGGQG